MLMEGRESNEVAGRYASPLPLPQLRGLIRRECNKRKEKSAKLFPVPRLRRSCKGTGHCRRKTNEQGTLIAVCPSLESMPSCPTTGSAPKAAIKETRAEVRSISIPLLFSHLVSSRLLIFSSCLIIHSISCHQSNPLKADCPIHLSLPHSSIHPNPGARKVELFSDARKARKLAGSQVVGLVNS
jgi:hypothetical protein